MHIAPIKRDQAECAPYADIMLVDLKSDGAAVPISGLTRNE